MLRHAHSQLLPFHPNDIQDAVWSWPSDTLMPSRPSTRLHHSACMCGRARTLRFSPLPIASPRNRTVTTTCAYMCWGGVRVRHHCISSPCQICQDSMLDCLIVGLSYLCPDNLTSPHLSCLCWSFELLVLFASLRRGLCAIG